MKLHWSPRSPFVRKVMVAAHDVGVAGRIECVRTVAAMMKPHPELMIDNPLSKIPTLVLDNGTVLYEVSNRGNRSLIRQFNRGGPSPDPESDADLGDKFLHGSSVCDGPSPSECSVRAQLARTT